MLQVLGSKIVVKPRSIGKTESGLIIPDGARQEFGGSVADVIAAGPDVKGGLKPGDVVIVDPRIIGMAPAFSYRRVVYFTVLEPDIMVKVGEQTPIDIETLVEEPEPEALAGVDLASLGNRKN